MAFRSRLVERPGSALAHVSGTNEPRPASALSRPISRTGSVPPRPTSALSELLLRERSRSPSRAVTKVPGSIEPVLTSPLLLIAAPNRRGEATLARPLTAGLRVAAAIASFDELSKRNLWATSHNETSFISHESVDALYDARCEDQRCASNGDRRCRFHALMSDCCRGNWFVLRQADLGPKSTQAIATMLEENEHITHLDLSGNHIGAEGAQYLAKLLLVNETICVLRLQSANLGDGCRTLATALQRNNTVTALDLSGISGIHRNSLWGNTVVALSEMLSENRVIAYLNLGACGLQKGAVDICSGAINNPALTYLGLSGNHIGDMSCGAVATFLQHGQCDLRTLDLANNGITTRGLSKISNALRHGGTPASALHTLLLNDNSINGCGLEEFAAGSFSGGALQTVNLSGNRLNLMGVDADGFKIPNSTSGLQALFNAFAANAPTPSTVTKLILARCDLDALPSTLQASLNGDSCSLTALDFSENRFGDAGLTIIGAMLRHNISLLSLRVHRNSGTAAGIAAVCVGVKVHPALEHLTFTQGVPFDEAVAIDAISASKSLLTVDLPRDALEAVAPYLNANKATKAKLAVPALADARRQSYMQQRSIDQAKELIAGEIKAKDKLTDTSRLRRERQKVQMAAFKQELQELEEAKQRGQHDVETLEVEFKATEDTINEQRRTLEGNLSRLKARLERQAHLKQTAMTNCLRVLEEHFREYPSSSVVPPPFIKSTCVRNADGVIERHAALIPQGALQHQHRMSMDAGSLTSPMKSSGALDKSMSSSSMAAPTPTKAGGGGGGAAAAATGIPIPAIDPAEANLKRELQNVKDDAERAQKFYLDAVKKAEELELRVANGNQPTAPAPAASTGKGNLKGVDMAALAAVKAKKGGAKSKKK